MRRTIYVVLFRFAHHYAYRNKFVDRLVWSKSYWNAWWVSAVERPNCQQETQKNSVGAVNGADRRICSHCQQEAMPTRATVIVTRWWDMPKNLSPTTAAASTGTSSSLEATHKACAGTTPGRQSKATFGSPGSMKPGETWLPSPFPAWVTFVRTEFADLSGNCSLRMNNKFPNEKLAGLEAPKLEVWGAFCREFQFLLGYSAGELLEKGG